MLLLTKSRWSLITQYSFTPTFRYFIKKSKFATNNTYGKRN
jgi:hypothetical protein